MVEMRFLILCTRKDKVNLMLSFYKIYNIKMKTIRKLNIKDWSGYFFTEMINILDIEPEYFIINDLKVVKMVQYCLTLFIVQKIVYLMLFLITPNVFLEKVVCIVI